MAALGESLAKRTDESLAKRYAMPHTMMVHIGDVSCRSSILSLVPPSPPHVCATQRRMNKHALFSSASTNMHALFESVFFALPCSLCVCRICTVLDKTSMFGVTSTQKDGKQRRHHVRPREAFCAMPAHPRAARDSACSPPSFLWLLWCLGPWLRRPSLLR